MAEIIKITSKLTYILRNYNRISRLTDDINNVCIAVKKYTLLQDVGSDTKYPKLTISEELYRMSKEKLILFLDSFLKLIDSGTYETDIARLSENNAYNKLVNNNSKFKRDIIVLLNTLGHDKALSKEQFGILDTVIGILDDERSDLFRKISNISRMIRFTNRLLLLNSLKLLGNMH